MADTFVPLGFDDCAAVAGLEARCFPSAWSEAQYQALVRKGVCKIFGARRDARLLAYIALGVIPGVPEAELYNIAVDPAERRKGYGRKLLSLAIRALAKAGMEALLLEVREGNSAAVALYEGAGFVMQGRRKNYYSAPVEDARLYRLSVHSAGSLLG